jgi:hypothetical protein
MMLHDACMSITPTDKKYPELPEDHIDNIMAKWSGTGYHPTRICSMQICFDVTKETEKAVLCDHEHWFPKSQVIVENNRVIAVKMNWWKKMERSAQKRFGF